MFGICFNVSLKFDYAIASVEYDADRLSPNFLKRLLTAFVDLVHSICTTELVLPLRYLSGYTSMELDHILRFSNANLRMEGDRNALLHQGFEHQATVLPENIAIAFWSKGCYLSTTYQGLDSQVCLPSLHIYYCCADFLQVNLNCSCTKAKVQYRTWSLCSCIP